MEKYVDRELKTKERVYHKNGDTQDNKIENLKIMDTYSHLMYHQNL